jgi:MHS family proline/betaine transporter-like MFS transporter
VLLVLGRCVQGVASGGEIGGAASYVAECSPPHRRGLLCSTTQLGALTGALLASAVVTLFTTVLGDETMKAWGWRIPFLIGLPLGLVGLWIRARLEDSPQFIDLAERGEVAKAPVVQLFANNRAALARTFGLSVLLFAAYYVVYVYAATHLQKTGGFSALTAFWSTIATLVLVFPGFMAMDAHGTAPAVLAQIVLGIPESALMAVAFSTFAEMLPARVRYSGIALGFNLASMAVGGTAPYICTWLINKTGDPLCPAWFLAGTALITLATTFSLRESAGTSLRTS